MSGTFAVPRPLTYLLALLAALALTVGLTTAPAWSVGTPDPATQTASPTVDEATDDDSTTQEPAPDNAPAAAPALEDFEVEYIGPECWDSSYNVSVLTDLETEGLRVALQEEINGSWVTLETERFYEGETLIYSDELDEGETATFQVIVYHRNSPAEWTVLHGPLAVTGVSTEGCDDDWDIPYLPEEQWTVAEAGCETVTFTSRAEEEVVVAWFGADDEDDWDGEENYFFLAPGESRTVETTHGLIYWVSVTGVDENLEPIEDEFVYAGEGEVEVEQDCAPAPGEPGEPGDPGKPAEPGDGEHRVPGRVQTDGGASASTMAIGLGLMALAGAALVRRTS